MKKLTAISMTGRRWFQRSCGNTFHTASWTAVYSDGEIATGAVRMRYGYGSQWEQSAVQSMQSAGVLPADGDLFPVSVYCRDNGIALVSSVIDVNRKKDL